MAVSGHHLTLAWLNHLHGNGRPGLNVSGTRVTHWHNGRAPVRIDTRYSNVERTSVVFGTIFMSSAKDYHKHVNLVASVDRRRP